MPTKKPGKQPGSPRRRLAVAAAVSVVALLALALAVTRWPARHVFYSDADTIRWPKASVTPRDVLWTPPRPLRFHVRDPNPSARPDAPVEGGAFGSAADHETYEPRLSWDGMTLYFVRGKAGGSADIYSSRLTPQGWTAPHPFPSVNSAYDELGPAPSPDGSAVYFYSDRPGGLGGYDLWVTHRVASADGAPASLLTRDDAGASAEPPEWQPPINLGPAVNSQYNDYGPAVDPANLTLYFASNRPLPDDERRPDPHAWPATVREDFFQRTYDLYQSRLTPQGPAPAQPLAALNTRFNEGAPCVSPSGDFVYFASDRPGGAGGFDLYRARRRAQQRLEESGGAPPHAGATSEFAFDPARTLGAEINTPANELDPGLTHLGFALFFSSDRAGVEELPGTATPRSGPTRPGYRLYASEAREVFQDVVTAYPPPIAWSQVWPWLLWLALLALLAALIYALIGSLRDKRLGLLARCLLASLLAHALLMLAFSFWRVSAGLAAAIRSGGPIEISLLPSAGADELAAQVRGSFTEIAAPQSEEPETIRADALPRFELAAERHETSVERAAPAAEEAVLVTPQPRASEPVQVALSSPAEVVRREAPPDPIEVALPRVDVRAPTGEAARPEVQADAASQPPRRPVAVTVHASPARSVEIAVVPIDAPAPETADPGIIAIPRESQAATAALTRPPATPAVASAPERQTGLALPAAGDTPDAAAEVATPPAQLALDAGRALRATPTAPATDAGRDAPPIDVEPARTEFALAADASPGRMIEPRPASHPSAHLAAAARTAPPAVAPAKLNLALPGVAAAADGPQSAPDAKAHARAEPGQPGGPKLGLAAVAPPSRAPVRMGESPASAARAVDVPPATVARADESPRAVSMEIHAAPATAGGAAPELASTRVLPTAPRPELSLRLPAGAPTPRTDYSQRAPEERLPLLHRMGGSRETEAAVSRALAWLARHQSADGSWKGRDFDANCGGCDGATSYQVDVALTGLSLLAFLGADHTHTRSGPYQENVRRGLTWLAERQRPDGDLRAGETMYSHGIAAIALAEASAMTGDASLRQAVARSAGFIDRARNREIGGWRYEPGQEGDTSVLGWVVMAARSAERAGVSVAPEVFEGALRWLELVGSTRRPGRYAYRPGDDVSPAMTAEGLFILELLGTPASDPRIANAVALLERNPPSWDAPNTYYWYYATLALFQQQGDAWRRWNQRLTSELLGRQEKGGKPAGSWPPDGEWAHIGGRVYQTALCTLMLEVYYRYLPMYGAERPVDAVGVVSGRVTDAGDGRPLADARVSFDRSGAPPLVAVTDAGGRYTLSIPEVPDFFALSAVHEGHVPASANVSALSVRGRTHALDFALPRASHDVVALEADPQVHHLGNDRFEGRINSQFQKSSQGRSIQLEFELGAAQLSAARTARLSLMVRGVQCPHLVRVNGFALPQRLNESPEDGSFGRCELDISPSVLVEGVNVLSIHAVTCNGDLDDFEFVNPQLELGVP